MANPSPPWHLLTASTSTMASTVPAIEKYLAVGSPGIPSCGAVEEVTTSPHLEQVMRVLDVQSEVKKTILTMLETPVSKEAFSVQAQQEVAQPVHSYTEVVVQSPKV